MRRRHYALIAAAAALPRLAVLLQQRGTITAAYVDKGDTFAQTYLATGTYGFVPHHPSAYTQPLYGFFLVPLYWVFERSWVVVGLAQLVVAVATALIVYEIGRRAVSPAAGVVAAVLTAVHPYTIWHDMHMNREILDELLAAATVLLLLAAIGHVRASNSLLLALATGAVAGVAILGNVRLVFLPLVLAAFLLWRRGRPALAPALVCVAAAAAVVAPWVVRNDLNVGCAAITTDGRALWKANNPQTLDLLRTGQWIDKVRSVPGAPITPQDAGGIWRSQHRYVATDECAQMRFYQHLAFRFMREHPGEKALLAGWGARMLWQPSVTKTSERPNQGTWVDTLRSSAEPIFMVPLLLLAIAGVFVAPRPFVVLALVLLAYQTVFAMLFVGETRYRVPWDFLIALLASAALVRIAERVRAREPAPA
jgi:4-amino-4-deoxy-L-arabinose transferase-like glycosyltransferase